MVNSEAGTDEWRHDARYCRVNDAEEESWDKECWGAKIALKRAEVLIEGAFSGRCWRYDEPEHGLALQSRTYENSKLYSLCSYQI